MATAFSDLASTPKQELVKRVHSLETSKKREKTEKKKSDGVVADIAVQSTTTAAFGIARGYMTAKGKAFGVGPVGVDGIVGALFLGAAATKWGRKHATLRRIGMGAAASALTIEGFKLGTTLGGGTRSAVSNVVGADRPMTDEELAASLKSDVA